jgi:hypothetical protein
MAPALGLGLVALFRIALEILSGQLPSSRALLREFLADERSRGMVGESAICAVRQTICARNRPAHWRVGAVEKVSQERLPKTPALFYRAASRRAPGPRRSL